MIAGATLALDKGQANYLLTVLRMREGAGLLVFNGRDGEWRAQLTAVEKKSASLVLTQQTRPQPAPSDIWLCFAPVRNARLDFMVQKAVEMGVAKLLPIITSRTQVQRLNLERLKANIIEAAEQCGVLAIPELTEEIRFGKLDQAIATPRTIIFCDELAEVADPLVALKALQHGSPVAVFIGPEGGFDADERLALRNWPGCIAIALGPRILRADTAIVAALSAVQLAIGDWR